VIETWTIVAGVIAAVPVVAFRIKEELLDRNIRNSRTRARAALGIGRSGVEVALRAGTREPPVGQGNFSAMEYTPVHCPASPVYEKLPSKARKSGLSRRDRALLAADVLQRTVDFSTWPVSWVAEAFGASARSVFEALNCSAEERNAIRSGQRPLFPRRSSIPEPTPTPAQYLERAIGAFGLDRTLTLLAEAGSAASRRARAVEAVTVDVTDIVEEAA
jgi:hypothetical protein